MYWGPLPWLWSDRLWLDSQLCMMGLSAPWGGSDGAATAAAALPSSSAVAAGAAVAVAFEIQDACGMLMAVCDRCEEEVAAAAGGHCLRAGGRRAGGIPCCACA